MTEQAQYLIKREEFQRFRAWLHICMLTGEKNGASKTEVRKVCREVCKHLENSYAWRTTRKKS